MGAAVAVPEPDRPSIFEVVAILAICAGLLVGLAILDDRAARREAQKAHAVLAERAERAAERREREAMTAPAAPAGAEARTDRLGREASPIVIPAGPAWGPATSVVSHTQRANPIPAAPPKDLRRIVGPQIAAAAPATPRAKPGTAATRPVERSDAGPVLLLLMAGAGISMAGAGIRLLSRRSA